METEPSSKYTKITIGGISGTGKGTVSKLLAERLGFERSSVGDFFRELAKERGFDSLLEFQQHIQDPENGDQSIDEMVDERTKQYGKEHDRFVMEGRLCAYMIPEAFNILLLCDDRRFARIAEREGISTEAAKEQTLQREALYSDLYKRVYDIDDYLNPERYDFAIDTSEITPEEVVDQIITQIT